jgi:histidine triad (HIT) family protein
MNGCTFCEIVSGRGKSQRLYQDDQVTAIRDIRPAAPVHILIIPNRHIASLIELDETDKLLVGHMLWIASRLAEQEGLNRSGYRLVINTGDDAGQTVFHLHLHLLGGQRMGLMLR